MINLSSAQQQEVLSIIYSELSPETEVWIFGSRARGSARPGSDLDLLLTSATPLDWQTLACIEEKLADSDLPFRVDLVDKQRTDSDFLHRIASELVPLSQRS